MENDETQVEVTPEQEVATTEVETEEVTTEERPLTVDDYKELEKKYKTALIQRDKWKQKANTNNELKQTNTQATISREEVLLISKGYELSDIDKAKKLAELNGVSLLEAAEDEYILSNVQKRKQTELSKRASLNASSNSPLPKTEKTPGEMTKEEHAEYFRKVMGA